MQSLLSRLAQVSPLNSDATTQTPRPPPPASLQCPLHRPRAPFLKIKGRRIQAKPNRVRPRPSSTLPCPQVMATPACPTTLECRECPVPSSMVPPSSCPRHPRSSTLWARPANTSTRLDTANTHMEQVQIPLHLCVFLGNLIHEHCTFATQCITSLLVAMKTLLMLVHPFWAEQRIFADVKCLMLGKGFDELSQAHAAGDYGKGGYGGSSQSQAKAMSNSAGKGQSYFYFFYKMYFNVITVCVSVPAKPV